MGQRACKPRQAETSISSRQRQSIRASKRNAPQKHVQALQKKHVEVLQKQAEVLAEAKVEALQKQAEASGSKHTHDAKAGTSGSKRKKQNAYASTSKHKQSAFNILTYTHKSLHKRCMQCAPA